MKTLLSSCGEYGVFQNIVPKIPRNRATIVTKPDMVRHSRDFFKDISSKNITYMDLSRLGFESTLNLLTSRYI